MQFFVTQQRIAKKMRQEETSWNSFAARTVQSKVRAENIAYIKLAPRATITPSAFVIYKDSVSVLLLLKFYFLFDYTLPMDF